MGTRINKYLSEIGYCSRRAADKLLEEGRITINGKKAPLGEKVEEGDVVAVNGRVVSPRNAKHVYIALNKPRGIVCTTDRRVEKDNIIDFIGHPQRIFPIGRLDKPSEGLILLTSDGDIVNKIHKSSQQSRKGIPSPSQQTDHKRFSSTHAQWTSNTWDSDKKCVVEQIGPDMFRIILTQGLNRQIRRMCEYLDYRVKRLKRIRIMNIELDLPVGKWRDLTKRELQELNRLCESQKTT